ncbi:antitoxin MazE [Modicisalibacter xianhensis]|uniref:Antitoxin MazE n=1 Tax=Modicisalibacter xianhensis TaxID=442341 RepID=A0A4R8G9I9_9GAMM|nr:AbrB/MazE/SpoVT family DNA-binding domain-containing protein [Halomonas xianhensis]TDX32182.1 antitoxin MazE [Halomonas xianhensis]
MKTEIKKWGNSAALRLPRHLLTQAHIDVSSAVEVTVENGKIIVQASVDKRGKTRFPYSEDQLLQGLDASTAHADEIASVSQRELGE